ncbi:MAG TPA: glycosyltransferase family 4 protein [Nocardioidaceae bacterium]|nr:glycosyltransferase family 4 protein [Nocardioidaceae bacterium]
MIGQKGVPATYGGVEHHVEELGSRLAARGHQVDVFCRPSYGTPDDGFYRGMNLRTTRTIGTKHLDAIGHSLVSSFYSAARPPDIVHYHALGPVLTSPVVRALSSSRVVVTVHGLDHERDKWGRGARLALGLGHWMSARVPHATVVVSRELQSHYAAEFGRECVYIPNGVDAPMLRSAYEISRRWGLRRGGFALFVGRLVPEKSPDLLIRAYRAVPGDLPLVIAGDSSFTDEYVSELRAEASGDPRVLLCGYVYGRALAELYSNAAVFVQPSRLEGMPLTLLEAASYGAPVVASDIPPHREIAGEQVAAMHLVPPNDERALADRIAEVLAHPEPARADALRRHVLGTFRWDTAAADLEALYQRLVD